MRVLEPFRPRFTAPDLEPFVVLAAAPGEPTPREIRAIQALRLAHVGYRNRDNPLIRQQLPHRDEHELAAAADRLGWASWEDRNAVVPHAGPSLTPTESDQAGCGSPPRGEPLSVWTAPEFPESPDSPGPFTGATSAFYALWSGQILT